jgi:ACS family tartrate transporter-like MFS transporter
MNTTSVAASAIRKVFLRLVPFSMLLMLVSLLDRTNISFGSLQMNQDLGLTPSTYGVAASILFLGYCPFEIPSNLILVRVGARRWLARIMISWGIVVGSMAFVSGTRSLYLTRFLLGAAEAGLLPGLVFYLSTWVPAHRRGLAYAALMSTTALGNIIGGPIAIGLMHLGGPGGLHGWQMMFLIEGIATVLLGFIVLRYLPDTYAEARWLDASEQGFLSQTHASDLALKQSHGVTSLRGGFSDRRVLLVTAVNFFLICCNFGTVYWLPQIIKSLGRLSNDEVGLLASIPFALGGLAMLLWGRHSDHTADRKWHLFTGAAVAAAGYGWAAASSQPASTFIGLCAGTLGIWSTFGVFWAYAGDLLGGTAAAGGLAFMNSLSTLGGLVSPALIGIVRERSSGFGASLALVAGFATLGALLALLLEPVGRADLVVNKTRIDG